MTRDTTSALRDRIAPAATLHNISPNDGEVYPLIGLVGHARAGKDTAGNILCAEFNYTKVAFAHELKRELYNFVGFKYAASFQEWLDWIDRHKHDAPDTEHGWIRPLLQFWGTEYRREKCDREYWIKRVPLIVGFVVTDVRFPNEATAIRRNGGWLINITRPDTAHDAHISEMLIDTINPHYYLHNDGDIPKLRKKLVDIWGDIVLRTKGSVHSGDSKNV